MRKKTFFTFLVILVFPLTIFTLTGEGTSSTTSMDTVDPEVTVNYPNGGEELYIGDPADITWSATDYGLALNPMKISHSEDNGGNYTILDSLEVNDGIYNWMIPSITSYANLIKILAEDSFGNIGEDISNEVFSITNVPPTHPTDVSIHLSSGTDAVISWFGVDADIYGTPITVDGYIVLYNETTHEDSATFLASTDNATTTYTDVGVAGINDRMFYQVVAFKDYRGIMGRLLSEINDPNGKRNKLSWRELKRRFK